MLGRVRKDLNVTHLRINVIRSLPIEKMDNLKKITLCGNFGDPLMHPDLDDVINFFHKQQIEFSTNASLRSKEWWSKLGANKNISVLFCIDGIGPVHELYRRNTSYKKIMENAKAFIQAGGNAYWQFIVFRHNEHQLTEAKKLSEEMGFKKIEFIFSNRFDSDNKWKVYDDNNYLYDIEKSSHQKTLRESFDTPGGEKYWKPLLKKRGEITCIWSEQKKLYIHSDGTVYPCCMLGSIHSGKNIEKLMMKKLVKDFRKINLHHHNMEEILGSEVFQKSLPDSFEGDPFQHPVCIEHCNKNTGKFSDAGKIYFDNKNISR
jgi:sulfatase maturation enzyme AslB (radical SAM superfamily)